MVTGVVPSSPRFLPSIFIAHRVQQSHCPSIFHRVLLTHALALFESQLVHKKKSQRTYTSMHSAGLALTKLTYIRLVDNLTRHRGDRLLIVSRVDFIVFVLFLGAVGVRVHCCTAVEIDWQLCASRILCEQRLDEPSSQRVGGFGLSRKPPKLRLWSCTQPRAAKATAGAAVVGSMGSIPRAAAVV